MHVLHSVEPALSEKRPVGQGLHRLDAIVEEKDPVSHNSQDARPSLLVYAPAGQATQSEVTLLYLIRVRSTAGTTYVTHCVLAGGCWVLAPGFFELLFHYTWCPFSGSFCAVFGPEAGG